MQMIICHPCHPSHLCQDPDAISRTFLEQFVLVFLHASAWKYHNHCDRQNSGFRAYAAKLKVLMPFDYMRKNFLNWFDLWLQFCEQTVPESTGDTEVAKIIHKKGDFHDCKLIGTHPGLLCKEGIWWESRSRSPWVPSFI